MKYIYICLFVVFIFNNSWASQKTYEVTTSISKDREVVNLLVTNNGKKDLFCPSLRVKVKFCNSNFCEVVGSTIKYINNVYVQYGSEVDIKLDDSLQSIRRSYPEAIIQDVVSLNESSCKIANFKNYCELADKTEDEEHTVKEILKYEHSSDCKFDTDKATSYTLKNKNIKSLIPFMYLPVERINLDGNNIEDVTPLSLIDTLWKVDISNNPVNSLTVLQISEGITHLRAINIP